MRVEIVNGADGGPLFKLLAESATDAQFIDATAGKNLIGMAVHPDGSLPILAVRLEEQR